MRQFGKRAAALGLALLMTLGSASASEALGWEIHTGQVALSHGAALGKHLFWSDTYSDLRTEYYVEYTPNASVTPTVAYGDKVLSRATLTGMAQGLEGQGRRVVSGLNGDYYVMATGAPVGLVVSGGVLRSTPAYTDSVAVGFYEDGTAVIGAPQVAVEAVLPTQTLPVTGGVNKVRQLSAADGRGGMVLLTSDFSTATQNTAAGVDVVLAPLPESTGVLAIGGSLPCTVEQVLESEGSVPIPEGRLILSVNGQDRPELLEALRALLPGDPVTINVASGDPRWNDVEEGLGSLYQLVSGGQVLPGLDAERTARSAIGVRADGTVIFYALDGKQAGHSVGGTLTQVAQRLVELGCVEAVCMDGGGSTTLGATYPDQSGMQVVNRPADGSQRSNSTAIFLTTGAQPTGVLSSYYVTPGDSVLLAGASVALSAMGLDSNYYPTAGGPVRFSAEGGGSVDENGLYTAGAESAFVRITASDGQAAGTAYITVVKTPDRITVSNEVTGGSLTTLGVDPGEQVNLKASASYRKMALQCTDENFTWSVDPAVGAIDGNGLFTAGEKTASGILTVAAGDTTVQIPVNVAGHVKALEACEGGLVSFTSSASAKAFPETNLDYVRYGSQSMRLEYDAGASGSACLATTLAIPSGEKYLALWVYGDGSGNALVATVADQAGETSQILLAGLDFTGWRHVSAPLPEGAFAIRSLDVIYGGAKDRQAGVLWLDHFTTSNEEFHDITPPTVVINVNGGTLAASVTDNVDRSTPKESIVITYDGAPVSFTWNEAGGVATLSLPDAGQGCHRVTVTATDASGNLGRASADLPPSQEREPLYADMEGEDQRGELYTAAAYLYDAGVIKGVPTEEGTILFQPGRQITRAEFFTMLARWMGLDLEQYQDVALPFNDAAQVPDWALGEVKAMYSLGILKGAGGDDGLWVNAQATISRAEVMTLLGRTQPKGYGEAPMDFEDGGQVPDWALPYAASLVSQGVVEGQDNKILPLSPATRGEVAKMLYFML